MKKLILLAALPLILAGCAPAPEVRSLFLFDTAVSITCYGGGCDGVAELLRDLDDRLNAYEGALFEANESGGSTDPMIIDAVSRALEISEPRVSPLAGALTELWDIGGGGNIPSEGEISAALATIDKGNILLAGGALTLRGGARIDLGGYAKGYACDKAREYLLAADCEAAVISLSSSALLYGEKPGGEPFITEIKSPFGGSLGTLETEAAFISTSGGYERYFEADGVRYCHIFDLQSGCPVSGDLASVTVVIPADVENGGIISDMLATELFCEGADGVRERLDGEYGIVAVCTDGSLLVSESLRFTPKEG